MTTLTVSFSPHAYNKGQLGFINEFAKSLLVKWAQAQLAGIDWIVVYEETLFFDYARQKGWVKKIANELTSSGFGVAAAFLRR